ncbi:hypothetical protein MTsPCn5_32090 [Croceitalea sp. MTPC5]|uniref:hypothetical protein n=1 Tax=Croceitalea sp. MTPC5 TaxID=3056565 RepID=UPI002B380E9F|nr:hypothetical protein MTsPCn5_32090 [Croceitalea sp. MTPC5]
MKYEFFFGTMILISVVNAQLVVDDFETGNLEPTIVTTETTNIHVQKGNTIIGKTRSIWINPHENRFGQYFQTTITEGLWVVTTPYDTKGTFYLAYGKNTKVATTPLRLDLSQHTHLHIQFEAKSTVNGLYAIFFAGSSRATYGKQLPASESAFIVTIPLSDFKKIGPNYRLSQIDGIRFQFDSRSKTGCSMAIDKIWFE